MTEGVVISFAVDCLFSGNERPLMVVGSLRGCQVVKLELLICLFTGDAGTEEGVTKARD